MCPRVKGKAALLHAKQPQRVGRGIALPSIDTGARRRWVVSAMPKPVPIVQKTSPSAILGLADKSF